MLKRFFAGLTLVAASLAAGAQDPAYTEIKPPMPTDSPGKIEVVEFFWYGCGHCYAFEPHLEKWTKQIPADVVFKRVPAMFNDQWAMAGRVYYTLESMGLETKLHRPLFDAIHKDRLRINNEQQLNDWLTRQGVDLEKFSAASRSFTVESKLKRALQLTQQSKIDGVPALVVNGHYMISSAKVRPQEEMLNITNQLAEKIRQSTGGTTSK